MVGLQNRLYDSMWMLLCIEMQIHNQSSINTTIFTSQQKEVDARTHQRLLT